jgi:hypothetical protein
MPIKYKRLSDYIKGFRIIYIMLKYSNVTEKQVRLIRQIDLIKPNRIISIIEDVLAALSIFAIGYLWLWVARGFGWH